MENQRENFFELKKNLIDSFKIFLLSSMINYYSNKSFELEEKQCEVIGGSLQCPINYPV
jgi:hypothetical protein